MKSFIALSAVLAGLVSFAVAEIGIYGQCGGDHYDGEIVCASGTTCTFVNDGYSYCSSIPIPRADDPVLGYAALGGTGGGADGPTTRVSTLDKLISAVAGNSPKTVILTASLTGNKVIKIGSNTSLLGANGEVVLHGIGLQIWGVSNVIVRNLKISKVLASAGDAISIQKASKVWIDHVDLSSVMDPHLGKDYYDGLLDITHGSTYVTVSWSHLHDHYKASLVGHTDDNGKEDKAITVTYHHNYLTRLGTRLPSIRFGTGHIYNNYFDTVEGAIDTRAGAQVLVENNVFVNTKYAVYSMDNKGYAVARGNDFGDSSHVALKGTLEHADYDCTLFSLDSVRSDVPSSAGATLNF